MTPQTTASLHEGAIAEVEKAQAEAGAEKLFTMYAGAVFKLQKLIQTESVSGGEKPIVDFLEQYVKGLKTEGLKCERIGDNLIVDYQVDPEKETIALVSHVDTVPFDRKKWARDPLGGQVEGGKIYGRGATDVKNGAAMFLSLIENLREEPPRKNLKFVFFAREETGTPNGLTEVLEAGKLNGVEYAVVIEPTDQKLVVGCFGNLAVELEVLGKEGHSSQPEKVENALENLAKLIAALREQKRDEVRTTLGNFGEEVISVTQANTQNPPNVIPGSVKVGIDYRYDPAQSPEAAEQKFRAMITATGVPIGEIEIKYNDLGGNPDGLPSDLAALQTQFGIPLDVVKFWTDIAQPIGRGIPAANLGPGSIDQAHKPDEFLKLKELQRVIGQLHWLVFSKN